MYIRSCLYTHPTLGAVRVKVHGTTMHVKARWIGQELCVTVPVNYPVADYDAFLEKFHDRLIASRPQPKFYIGRIIDAPLVDFTIALQARRKSTVAVSRCAITPQRGKKINYTIGVAEDLAPRINDPAVQKLIGSMVMRAARHAAESFIVPHADALATAVGRRPLGWEVRDTRTRLGSCSSSGIITLAARLIFLPRELSDFVIYHELAHLSEMNHSEAFHKLCNSYCGGKEALLNARLKKFDWPI